MTASIMETGRRRFLLGLAAAATAAATATATTAATLAENPKLLALADDLPSLAQAYQAAWKAYREMQQRWIDATPLAPDEMTEAGRSWTEVGSTWGIECSVLGGRMRRYGEKFPRRIVLKTWELRRQLSQIRAEKRKAKRNGSVVDYVAAGDEVKRLKDLIERAEAYDNEFASVKVEAEAERDRVYPVCRQLAEKLAALIADIMAEEDRTMEGLIIKAEALSEWENAEKGDKIIAGCNHGHWHGAIAASILRHAKGGAI